MRRIQITLFENKKGWSWQRAAWDSEVNRGARVKAESKNRYITASDCLESLIHLQMNEDIETCEAKADPRNAPFKPEGMTVYDGLMNREQVSGADVRAARRQDEKAAKEIKKIENDLPW